MIRDAIRLLCLIAAVGSFAFGFYVKLVYGLGSGRFPFWQNASLLVTLAALGVLVLLDRQEKSPARSGKPHRRLGSITAASQSHGNDLKSRD